MIRHAKNDGFPTTPTGCQECIEQNQAAWEQLMLKDAAMTTFDVSMVSLLNTRFRHLVNLKKMLRLAALEK